MWPRQSTAYGRGIKVCSTGPCCLTNMPLMPIYGKKISGTMWPLAVVLGM